MKVILLVDVKKVGKKGETVTVSDGYGSNFLIPRGLAKPSTEATQKELSKNNAEEAERQRQLKKEAEETKVRLENINVEFKAKVGKDGRMFGTISTKEIEAEMLKQWGIKIDKRKFLDKEPVNAIGFARLRIELYKGSEGQVVGTVNVHVSEEK